MPYGYGGYGSYGLGMIPLSVQTPDFAAAGMEWQRLSALKQAQDIQAQQAANQNALMQQTIQSGQMNLDAAQRQNAKIGAISGLINKFTTSTPEPIPPVAAPAIATPAYPMATTAPTRALDAQTAAGKPVLDVPAGDPSLVMNHPAVTSFLNSTPNTHVDISKAIDPDNPTFAAVHTFDSVDPKTGRVIHNTFDRQGYIDALNKAGYSDEANEAMNRFVASDAASEKLKQDAKVAQSAQLLGMTGAFKYMTPDQQDLLYNSVKQRAQSAGLDISTWPADIKSPAGQAWVTQQEEEARLNNQTAVAASKRAENAMSELKTKAQIGLIGAQQAVQPSIAAKNLAEAAKARGEGGGAGAAPGGGGAVQTIDDVPAQYRGMVQKLASGELQLSDLPARTGPGQVPKTQFMSWVSQLYPEWDSRLSAQSKKTVMDYSPSGTSGKAITSLGAIAEHTQILRQAYQAMQNGDIPTLNKLAGSIGAEVGGSAKTTYNTMASVYAGEVDKFMSGNNPTEGGARTWAHNLNYGMSPKQAQGAFDTLDTAVVGKLQPYDQAYFNATKKHLTDTDLLTPAAKGLASRFTPRGGGAGSAQPFGAGHPAAEQMKDGTISQSGKYVWHNGWVPR